MSDFVLPLLPDGSLASSVVTTVWAGVLVVCFLNLRFGWVLSGLVVPGYIVPLLIIKPLSAVVVMVEASLVYGIFYVLSERLSGPRSWSSFFGRDRFMGLILVSVIVRLVLDGWLLPIAANELRATYGWNIEWANSLHSFGLILIALLANQMWKPGFVRGMGQSLVMIGATFLIVRYGLMEFTNFRIGPVAYLYEDFATSILATPKAYIILIVTCFIASRLNLRYGWDFSGILIPALLALQWYQPLKIATSIVEALVIFFLANALLSSRLFAGSTIEGARKILLFFNISFAYRLVLGHGLDWADIEYPSTDFYGFGYLLPTLIALKAHEKGILPRLLRGTVQTSLGGALLGSAIGFLLAVLVPRPDAPMLATARKNAEEPVQPARLIAAAIGAAHVEEAREEVRGLPAPSAGKIRRALLLIEGGRTGKETRRLLGEAGYLLRRTTSGGWAVQQHDASGALLLFDPSSARQGCVKLEKPLAAPSLGLAALALQNRLEARWLAIGEGRSRGNDMRVSSPLAAIEEAVGPCLRVEAAGDRRATIGLAGDTANRFDLSAMGESLPELQTRFANIEQGSFLNLSPEAIDSLLARRQPVETPANMAPFTREELAFLRFEVLEPLFMRGAPHPSVNEAAAALGFEIVVQPGDEAGPTIVLRRRGVDGERFLIRPRADGPVLQVPSEAGLQDVAGSLFEEMGGRALLVVSSRVALDGRNDDLLALVTQAALRSAPEGNLILQVRRMPASYAAPAESRALLATDWVRLGPSGDRMLVERLARAGVDAQPIEWEAATAGLEIGPSSQLRFARQTFGARTAILWMPTGAGR